MTKHHALMLGLLSLAALFAWIIWSLRPETWQ